MTHRNVAIAVNFQCGPPREVQWTADHPNFPGWCSLLQYYILAPPSSYFKTEDRQIWKLQPYQKLSPRAQKRTERTALELSLLWPLLPAYFCSRGVKPTVQQHFPYSSLCCITLTGSQQLRSKEATKITGNTRFYVLGPKITWKLWSRRVLWLFWKPFSDLLL